MKISWEGWEIIKSYRITILGLQVKTSFTSNRMGFYV